MQCFCLVAEDLPGRNIDFGYNILGGGGGGGGGGGFNRSPRTSVKTTTGPRVRS